MNGIFDGFFGTILGWGRMGSKSDQLHNAVRSYVHISRDDDVDDDDDDQWSIVIVDLRGYKSVNKREHTEHIFGTREVRVRGSLHEYNFEILFFHHECSHGEISSFLLCHTLLYTYIG